MTECWKNKRLYSIFYFEGITNSCYNRSKHILRQIYVHEAQFVKMLQNKSKLRIIFGTSKSLNLSSKVKTVLLRVVLIPAIKV